MAMNNMNGQYLMLPQSTGFQSQNDGMAALWRTGRMIPIGQIGQVYANTRNRNPEESDAAVRRARQDAMRFLPGLADRIAKIEDPSVQRENYNARRIVLPQRIGGRYGNNQMAMLFRMFLAMLQGQNPQLLQQLIGQQPQQVQAKKTIGETKDAENEFTTMDSDGNGEVSFDEFLTSYIRSAERSIGKQIKKGSPDWLKYEAEAKNVFGTLKERTFCHPFEGRITKERYQQYLKYLDRADGNLDGKYDIGHATGILEKIKESGKDIEVSAGKTLPQLIDMEG